MAAKIELSPEETDELKRWIKSGKTEQRKVERAKIVLRSAQGKPTHQIAKELETRPTRVSKWRKRFAQLRVPGLRMKHAAGAESSMMRALNVEFLINYPTSRRQDSPLEWPAGGRSFR